MINERKVLKNRSVLLGITGSVAAYKSVDLIRRLREEGASVTVVLTEAAQHFITPLSLEVASQNRVYSDLFKDPMSHVTLPSRADVMVIAPATANIIGKCARGIADDLLSTIFLAFRGKVIIAPAMNWRMYEHPILQENINYLLSHGIIKVGPERGSLACGEEGIGKMAEISEIVESIKSSLTHKDLVKEKIIVTAGPTREHLDPVRFLSNRSSGKMGYALARTAFRRGGEVTLISGYSSLPQPKGIEFITAETASKMFSAVKKILPSSTLLIMSAAVSDFMPSEKFKEKIVKNKEFTLRLVRSPDILTAAGKKKKRPFIIGFAAETGERLDRARSKLRKKNIDMIVFNDVTAPGSGFEEDTNKVVIIDKEKETELPLLSKDSVAEAIFDRFIEIRSQ